MCGTQVCNKDASAGARLVTNLKSIVDGGVL